MAYDKKEAVRLVIEAGHRLVSQGLAARTWGNISARISDTQFVITPSGLAYETLREADIVTVQIADGTYEGSVKPSSEKGIHAECYKYRPDVDFVIHTHQLMATAVGVTGQGLAIHDQMLGGSIPCAPYAISSTKALKRNVSLTLRMNPNAKAFFLRSHGALCLGKDCEEAFETALRLEEVCRGEVERRLTLPAGGEAQTLTLPDTLRGQVTAPCLLFSRTPAVAALSRTSGRLRPAIDDMAQIGGVDYDCVKQDENWAQAAAKGLRGRNAVLVQNEGAICSGATMDEAQAVAAVLEKNCLAILYGRSCGRKVRLGYLDALLQRTVYVKKYAKLKSRGA